MGVHNMYQKGCTRIGSFHDSSVVLEMIRLRGQPKMIAATHMERGSMLQKWNVGKLPDHIPNSEILTVSYP